jgi:hypothetical protein
LFIGVTRQIYQAVRENGRSDVDVREDNFIKRLQELPKGQYGLTEINISTTYTSHINVAILNGPVHSFQRN